MFLNQCNFWQFSQGENVTQSKKSNDILLNKENHNLEEGLINFSYVSSSKLEKITNPRSLLEDISINIRINNANRPFLCFLSGFSFANIHIPRTAVEVQVYLSMPLTFLTSNLTSLYYFQLLHREILAWELLQRAHPKSSLCTQLSQCRISAISSNCSENAFENASISLLLFSPNDISYRSYKSFSNNTFGYDIINGLCTNGFRQGDLAELLEACTKSQDNHSHKKKTRANEAPLLTKEIYKKIMTRSKWRNQFLCCRSEKNKKACNK